MIKLLILALIFSIRCFGITDEEKTQYGLKFHEAFILQSLGQSTKAFFTFQNGYVQASQLGEDPRKLIAISNQFMWYRKYGSYTKLFAIEPTGRDVISDQYKGSWAFQDNIERKSQNWRFLICSAASPLAPIPYHEYRDSDFPELAEHRRNYILGVGEVVAGLLFISRGGFRVGGTLVGLGLDRIWDAANPLLSRKDALAKQELLKSINEIKAASPPRN